MQVIPGTYKVYKKQLKWEGYHTPEFNIIIGTQMLKDYYDYWKPICKDEIKTWKYVIASYNAGKGKVIRYKGIPPYKETKDFVKYIMI